MEKINIVGRRRITVDKTEGNIFLRISMRNRPPYANLELTPEEAAKLAAQIITVIGESSDPDTPNG